MVSCMKRLVVMHTKGGVGKTTSAIYLGMAAHLRGLDVSVVDADPQGSALDWASVAQAHGAPLPYPLVPAGRKLPEPSGDLAIIDTPPGTAPIIQTAIDAADLVVVPAGATPLEIRRVRPTLEVTAHRPTVVLLTRVDLRTRLIEEARMALDNDGVPVIRTVIVNRTAIPRQFGLAPHPAHLYGYDEALTELLEVLTHV